jgi:hypothetical protein
MNTEVIVLSEINKSQKDKCHLYEVSRLVKFIESRIVVLGFRRMKDGVLSLNRYRVAVLQDEESCGDLIAQQCECT